MEKVTARDLHLWDIFLNSNNHLSMVIKETDTYISVINYNGSIYDISKIPKHKPTYKLARDQSKERKIRFFEEYPISKLNWHLDKEALDMAYHILKIQSRIRNLLLMV